MEILSIDLEKKRVGVSLVSEGSARAGGTARSQPGIALDAEAAEDVREHTEREDPVPAKGIGSLAGKMRGALERREK